MRTDTAYHEELAGRLYGLLIGLDDRIGSEQARLLHHFIEVGEYGLALEEIAGTLAQGAVAITGQQRGDMLALAARMNLEGGLVPPRAGGVPADRQPRAPLSVIACAGWWRLRLDLRCGAGRFPAGQVIPGRAQEGVPCDGRRAGHVRCSDAERDDYPDIAGTPAEPGRDLG